MLDPNQVIEAFIKTSTLLPTALPTHSVAPIPTVIPSPSAPVWEKTHSAGKITLWVAFAIFFISTLILGFLAWRTPVQKRLFHILVTFLTAISTIAYYAQATGAGSTVVHYVITETHKHVPNTFQDVYRQVFWAHTVDSAITFPVVILTLALLAGISGANILVIILAHIALALTTVLASFATMKSASKWGWIVHAVLAFLVIVYQLVVPGRRAINAKGDVATGKFYAAIGGYTLVIWILYLVVWGVTEGTRNWSVDTEIIAYAVLDILAKPVFAFWLIFAYGKKSAVIDGFWTHGLASEGTVRLEDEEA
ncbi:hypothetical protein BJ878DRAFT_421210 [Calycina marina]|uniref:Opsin-1 n=1 Tax=Calycina marina TaxID=1763456 RepID=A0A9P7Z2R9_9HELO|nr:hypothetical protein BJ878DRAFT_421210 [Calycina marina]